MDKKELAHPLSATIGHYELIFASLEVSIVKFSLFISDDKNLQVHVLLSFSFSSSLNLVVLRSCGIPCDPWRNMRHGYGGST